MNDNELAAVVASLVTQESLTSEWVKAVLKLTDIVASEPELTTPLSVRAPFGVQNVVPQFVAQKMLLLARETGDQNEAVAWLRKIPDLVANGEGSGAAIKAIYGVECDEVIPVSEFVDLYPIQMLPESRLLTDLLRRYERTMFEGPISQGIIMPPRAALVRRGSTGPIRPAGHEPQNFPGNVLFEELNSAARLLALLPKAIPIEAARWYHYSDPDIALLCQMGLARQGSDYARAPIVNIVKVTQPAIAGLFDAFERLNQSHKNVLALALERVIRSRGQLTAGNRAIDLAIALEVLFMGADQGEHSYKISLRVARLLRTGIEDRRSEFHFIRRLYDLRSVMVHTGTAKDPWAVNGVKMHATALVDAADVICTEAIRKFLELGSIPEKGDWVGIELT